MRHGTPGDADTSAQVLAAYARGDAHPTPGLWPKPEAMLRILDTARMRAPFAKALLKSRELRCALAGHGVTMARKKWSVDTEKVAMRMREALWQGDGEHVAGRCYELAEEVLLTYGKTESWRHQRALLDSYGRLAKVKLQKPRSKRR